MNERHFIIRGTTIALYTIWSSNSSKLYARRENSHQTFQYIYFFGSHENDSWKMHEKFQARPHMAHLWYPILKLISCRDFFFSSWCAVVATKITSLVLTLWLYLVDIFIYVSGWRECLIKLFVKRHFMLFLSFRQCYITTKFMKCPQYSEKKWAA